MKQLSLFDTHQLPTPKPTHWVLYTDGAARNNPGPAGAGVYITRGGVSIVKEGWFLGDKTNNQAEYLALIIGLCVMQKHATQGDIIEIRADSQLLIRQLAGAYKVRNEELRLLYKMALHMLSVYHPIYTHVPRVENDIADTLANQGIDQKKRVPAYILTCMKHHGITIE